MEERLLRERVGGAVTLYLNWRAENINYMKY